MDFFKGEKVIVWIDAEKSSGDLKARYRQRAATLERLADELVNYFTNTIGIAERREQLENEISTLRGTYFLYNLATNLSNSPNRC